jgi:hypothetical protein
MRGCVILLIMCLALAAPAHAKKEKYKTPSSDSAPGAYASPSAGDAAYGFSAHDRITIQTFYREHATRERRRDDRMKGSGHGRQDSQLPRGMEKKLARTGELPPGWTKKLQRGDVVGDAGWTCRQPVPDDLRRSLPPSPPGTELVRIEDRIFRIMRATREILDVLDIRF